MSMPAWTLLPFGLVIGSWLGVLIRRFGTKRGSLWVRSACESCGAALRPADLVPVFSFLWLRGKCRYCRAPVAWFHVWMELASLAVAAAALLAEGGGPMAWVDAGLGWALLLAGWIDAEHFILPDAVTLPLVLAGLAVTWGLGPGSVYDHAAAAALGYVGFWALNAGYRAWRGREGLGGGDAKLLAASGAWLGLALLPDEILVAGLLALLAAAIRRLAGERLDAATRIAFGPALALALFGLRLLTD
jgi:leader peptidase (prepilin peptidase)/N-methyltransferase